jgi:hypothetical protein
MTFKGAVRFAVLIAFAAVSAGMAWADGSGVGDPTVLITAPKDADCVTDTCFTTNSFADPLIITPVGSSFVANFDYIGTATLDALFVEIVPTLPNTLYSCALVAVENPSFAGMCSEGVKDDNLILSVMCSPTASCSGLTTNEAVGLVVISPEPNGLLLLALGLSVAGFYSWKNRKAIKASRAG